MSEQRSPLGAYWRQHLHLVVATALTPVLAVCLVALRACRGWRRSVGFYDLTTLLTATAGGLRVDDVHGGIAELEQLADVAPEAIIERLQRMVCGYDAGGTRQAEQRLAGA